MWTAGVPNTQCFQAPSADIMKVRKKKKKTAGVARKFSRIYWPELGWEEMFLQAVCYRAGREGTHWRTGD